MSLKTVKYLGSVLATAGIIVNPIAAQAGGMGQPGMAGRSANVPNLNCRQGGNSQMSRIGANNNTSINRPLNVYSNTEVNNNINASRSFNVYKPTTVNNNVDASKSLSVYKPVNVNKNVDASKSTSVYKPVTVNKNIDASKSTSIYKPVNITNNIDASKNVNVNKNIDASKNININKNIDASKNINITKNIDNSKYIDNSKNIDINKTIIINKGGHGGGGSNSNSSSQSEAEAIASAIAAAISHSSSNSNAVINFNGGSNTAYGGNGYGYANANASAGSESYASAFGYSGAGTVIGGSSAIAEVASSVSSGDIGTISVEAPAPAPVAVAATTCTFQETTVIKAIHAVCVSADSHEFPASHMIGDTWINAGYEGEIARCLPGSHLKVTVGAVFQSSEGMASGWTNGQNLECGAHEALRHFKGGMLKCAVAVAVPDCTERTNLRKWGTGDMFFTYRARVCMETHQEFAAIQAQDAIREEKLRGYSRNGY